MRIKRKLFCLALLATLVSSGRLQGFGALDDYENYWQPVCDGTWGLGRFANEFNAVCGCSSSTCETERSSFEAASQQACTDFCAENSWGVDPESGGDHGGYHCLCDPQ